MNIEKEAQDFVNKYFKPKTPLVFCKHGFDNHGEFSIMILLAQKGDMTVGEISEELSISTARVSVILKNMMQKGYVDVFDDSFDKRKTIVGLSQKARQIANEKKEQRLQLVTELFLLLGKKDTANFLRIFEKITNFIDEKEKKLC